MTNSIPGFHSKARTKTVKIHIVLSFVYKIIAIFLNLALIPISVKYLGVEQYGVWVTLLGILSWATFFDFGLGNGLRNKLGEAISSNKMTIAKTYVSTSYAVIGMIAFLSIILVILIAPLVPWCKVFNTYTINNHQLTSLVILTSCFIFLNLVLALCTQVLYANQKASFSTLRQFLVNLFAVSSIYLISRHSSRNILYIGLCYGLSMIFANLLLTLYNYIYHRDTFPSLKFIEIKEINKLTPTGLKFFLIQISSLIVLTCDKILITQLFGPKSVTTYDVAFRLFSIILIGHSVISEPLWSAYTDAYTRKDFFWINSVLSKLCLLIIPFAVITSILVFFSKPLIDFWIDDKINVQRSLTIFIGIYVIVRIWNSNFASFLNGISEIRLQMFTSLLMAITNIPLSYFFAKYLMMGNTGVIIGTIISLSYFSILGPFQSYKIIRAGILKN